MIDITYTLTKLIEVGPIFLGGLILSLVLTPIVGHAARYLRALDIPVGERRRRRNEGEQDEQYASATPRLGGLAIYISFILLLFFVGGFTRLTIGIGIGVTLLSVVGFFDDIHDFSGVTQFLFHLLAAVVIVLAGVKITSVDIFGVALDFSIWEWTITLLNIPFAIVFPADLITILWLIIIINAMNWVAGIDALEETMAWVAGLTLMFLAIKFGKEDMLVLTTLFTGATIGFWFFNFPPARIYGGTIANTLLGYLLAIFAIEIDGKFTTAILLLALPVVDFLWVLVGRVVKYREFNPVKLMSISGHHHFHHRLMEYGYSAKQTLLVEVTIFSLFAVAAYYFAGFNIVAVAVVASFGILFLLFTILTAQSKKRSIRRQILIEKELEEKEKNPEPPEPQKPPESVYAY